MCGDMAAIACLSLHITLCNSSLWHDHRIKLHARTQIRWDSEDVNSGRDWDGAARWVAMGWVGNC